MHKTLLAAMALTVSVLGAQTTFSNSTPINLSTGTAPAAGNPYPSNITVSSLAGTVAKVTVTLQNFTHNVPADVDVMLVAPTGAKLVIMSDIGDFITPVSGATITLDDAAASALPSSNAAFPGSGTFRPTSIFYASDQAAIPPVCSAGACPLSVPAGTGTLANTFNGIAPNGTWSLYVYDDTSQDSGQIAGGWSMTITTAGGTAPTSTTVASSSGGNSRTGASVTFTATVASGGTPVVNGTITFSEGATTLLAPAPLSGSGQATFTTTSLTEGTHVIAATYSGVAAFGPSAGSVTETVSNPTVQTGNVFCNPGVFSIPKLPETGPALHELSNPFPSNIFVSGLTGSLATITVNLIGLAHSNPQDVDMLLVAPGGRSLDLFSDVGGSASTVAAPVTFTLSDGASTLLPAATRLISGVFRPTAVNSTVDLFPSPAPASFPFAAPFGTTTLFQAFNGINPNGTWQLFATGAVGNSGALNGGWCLSLGTSAAPPTTTTVKSVSDPSFTGDNVQFTAAVVDANNAPVISGAVSFTDGSHALTGPIAVDGLGHASFGIATLTEGSHTITATYTNAGGLFAASFGSVVQVVDNHTTVSGTSYCNPGPIAIPAVAVAAGTARPYPSHIFVANLAGVIGAVTLSLNNYTYSFPNDVQMLLAGPSGAGQNGLDLFSHTGGTNPATGLNITLDDAATGAIPASGLLTGSYQPTSATATNVWPAPAPPGPYQFAQPAGTSTFGSVFGNTGPNGTWGLYIASTANGSSGSIQGPVCLNFTIKPPVLSIAKTHSGNFFQGQSGATYTIQVTNNGPGSTAGTVTVTDTLPTSLTATGMAGTGWTCTLTNWTCTRSDGLPAGQSYPPITVTVNVAPSAPSTVTNMASASGGGAAIASANDPTTISGAPDLTIVKTHSGSVGQGQTGVVYNIAVSNIGGGATSGTVTVTDTLPAGLTGTAVSGTGWTCTLVTATCFRNDALAPKAAYPPIVVTVNVAANAPPLVTNQATVAGGGDLNLANNTAYDATVIGGPSDLTIAKTHSGNFTQGQTGAVYSITVGNIGAIPTSGTVTVTDTLPSGLTATAISGTGWACTLATATCFRSDAPATGTAYAPIVVTVNVAANAPPLLTNQATVAGGGDGNPNNNIAFDATAIMPSGVAFTVATSPAGLAFTVDGVAYTTAQIFQWQARTTHTIATTTPQAGSPGTRFVFARWSDGGAISHKVTAPAFSAVYTASFNTQYQLNSNALPSHGGFVLPVSGRYFTANSTVKVIAVSKAGNSFVNWTGPVSQSKLLATTVTMTGPASVTANFRQGGTNLLGLVRSKQGTPNARVWTAEVFNTGPEEAAGVQMLSFTLTPTAGAACTPVVTSPTFPLSLGTLGPGRFATARITINFGGCGTDARFTVSAPLQANNGAATGMILLTDQAR